MKTKGESAGQTEEEIAAEIAKFEAGAQTFAKKILGDFKNFEFYRGDGEPTGM